MGWSKFWKGTKDVSCSVGRGVAKGYRACANKVDAAEEKVFGEGLDEKFSRVGKAFCKPKTESNEIMELLKFAKGKLCESDYYKRLEKEVE